MKFVLQKLATYVPTYPPKRRMGTRFDCKNISLLFDDDTKGFTKTGPFQCMRETSYLLPHLSYCDREIFKYSDNLLSWANIFDLEKKKKNYILNLNLNIICHHSLLELYRELISSLLFVFWSEVLK